MSSFKYESRSILLLFTLTITAAACLSACSGGGNSGENKSSIRTTIDKPEAKIKEATESHQKQMETKIESSSASSPKP